MLSPSIQSACICDRSKIVKALHTDVATHMLLLTLIVIARRHTLRRHEVVLVLAVQPPSFIATRDASWPHTIAFDTAHCSNLQSNAATHKHLRAEIVIVRSCAKRILRSLHVWQGSIVAFMSYDKATNFTIHSN